MTFSFDWDDVRPMRTYWHTANQMCYGTGTVWGRGTSGGVNRDRDVVTPSTCGSMDGAPGSVTFCSWNKVRGDGSSVQMIQWRLNAAWRYHRSVAPIWPDPSAPMPTAEHVEQQAGFLPRVTVQDVDGLFLHALHRDTAPGSTRHGSHGNRFDAQLSPHSRRHARRPGRRPSPNGS